MSGRRGTGRNLQAQWEADNPGHVAAAVGRTSAPVPPEVQQDQMANVEASGYTGGDPLEFEEFTGGAQWEEDIEEPPDMLVAPNDEHQPLPTTGPVRQTERRRRFADIELDHDRLNEPYFVRASDTPSSTSELPARRLVGAGPGGY